MKKKELKELRNLSISELENKANDLRREITRLKLEFSVNKPKDTNIVIKKRKDLAVVLTLITEKKIEKEK